MGVAIGTLAPDVPDVSLGPEGLFPRAGHRHDPGDFGCAAEHFLCPDGGPPAGARQGDPSGSRRGKPLFLYRRGWNQSRRRIRGRIQITLKPLEDRDANASDIIRRLQPKLAQIPGITLYMQPVQDLSVENRVSRTQYQYTIEGPDAKELNAWAPKLLAKLAALKDLRDVATDQQNDGLGLSLNIDRDTASRLGVTPADDRQRPLRCFRPAAGLDDLHAIEPVPRGAGSPARMAAECRCAARHLRADRFRIAGAAQCPRSRRNHLRRPYPSTIRANFPP